MCLFCKIIAKEIPSTCVYENDKVYCFRDINPVAPSHVLVVPKKHFDNISDLAINDDNAEYLGEIVKAIDEVKRIEKLEDGFRVINNCGKNGGQTVNHVHFHVIGGTELGEKLI